MLTGCQFTEVFRCLWNFVVEKLDDNSPSRFLVNRDVELVVQTHDKTFSKRLLLTKTFALGFDGVDLDSSLNPAHI